MVKFRSVLDRFCFLLCLVVLPAAAFASDDTVSGGACDDYALPRTLSLCGETIPLEERYSWEMLDREFTIAVWDRAQVFMWLKRAGRYFPYIEKMLAQENMPQDLKYLALAESALIGYIRSSAGAKGYWQFMAQTARRSGLRKDHLVDERLSIEHSTEAALRYLRELKERFGTWLMAMAAYNCGENRLEREIKEQRVSEYFRLNLPIETERYVFRIAAIKIVMENPEKFGFRIPAERIYRPIPIDSTRITTTHRLHLTDIAHGLGTDFKTLKELNPQILGYHLPIGEVTLKVPAGLGDKLPKVISELAPPPAPVSQGSYYVVKSGDTLSRVARQTGVPVSRLRDLNGIDGSIIKIGQKLRLQP